MLDTSVLKQQLAQRKQIKTAQANIQSTIETVQPNIPEKITAPPVQWHRLSANNRQALEEFIKILVLKGYSHSTIRTYKNEFMQLLTVLKNKDVQALTTEEIKRYLLWCIVRQELTENAIHSRMNALKFYFEQVLKREKLFFEIPRPKKRNMLPKVISEEKILKVLMEMSNLKHKTILMLAYSAGLRVSEVTSLKITDIDSDRMQISINNAKGKKDRVVTLSNTLLPVLREYYRAYKPKTWLFEGQYNNEPYSIRSAQIIFRQAADLLQLPPHFSFHSLRHSYATHLLENGTDISYIQKLLGHNDIKTTLRYAQVSKKDISKVESPLDKIMRKKKE